MVHLSFLALLLLINLFYRHFGFVPKSPCLVINQLLPLGFKNTLLRLVITDAGLRCRIFIPFREAPASPAEIEWREQGDCGLVIYKNNYLAECYPNAYWPFHEPLPITKQVGERIRISVQSTRHRCQPLPHEADVLSSSQNSGDRFGFFFFFADIWSKATDLFSRKEPVVVVLVVNRVDKLTDNEVCECRG